MSLKISKLAIQNFRKLIRIDEIKVGKKVTVISGVNGVGKSNLLSLIASGSGLTRAKPTGGNFQPNFTEYFKIDSKENFEDYKIYIEYKNQDDGDTVKKRLSFKDDSAQNRGIRVIPRTSNFLFEDETTIEEESKRVKEKYNIGGAGRVKLPTIFLSLARLFPLGESLVTTTNISNRNHFFQNNAHEKYKEWYNIVLPGSIKQNSTAKHLSKEATNSNSFYIPLKSTTEQTQSVGQDNLGHIISALVDFYLLSLEENYNGGILCIDEIDASLHPSAQRKLLDLLVAVSDQLNIQIFLSTHSLTILKEILKLSEKESDNYQLIYFKDTNMPYPATYKNYRSLKADLFDELRVPSPIVKIYCEDRMTQQILKLLLKAAINLNIDNIHRIPEHEVIPVYLGSNQLMKLFDNDSYFKNISILVDGDSRNDNKIKIKDYIINPNIDKGFNTIKHSNTIVFLPGFLPPESYLYYIVYEYVNNKIKHTDFWRALGNNPDTTNFTTDKVEQNFLNISPLENDSLKKETYIKNLVSFFEESNILTDYYKDNMTELELFISDLKKSLDIIQKKLKARGY